MIQVAVPSRGEDTHYQQEREDLERLIGEVNGTYSDVGHAAIHYLHQSVDLDELIALYLAADVMLVTPLRDGMNLVAKEYVASRVERHGRAGAERVRGRGAASSTARSSSILTISTASRARSATCSISSRAKRAPACAISAASSAAVTCTPGPATSWRRSHKRPRHQARGFEIVA